MGLYNYLYYFGGSLSKLWYNGPPNPVLMKKAPMLYVGVPHGSCYVAVRLGALNLRQFFSEI